MCLWDIGCIEKQVNRGAFLESMPNNQVGYTVGVSALGICYTYIEQSALISSLSQLPIICKEKYSMKINQDQVCSLCDCCIGLPVHILTANNPPPIAGPLIIPTPPIDPVILYSSKKHI